MSMERMPPGEHYPPHRDNDRARSVRPDDVPGANASAGSDNGASAAAPYPVDATTLARYQALLEQAVDAIFVANQGHFVEVNPAACALLGYSREALLGMRLVDLIPPEDVPRLETALGEMSRGETHRSEWRLRRKNGSFVPVEVSARFMPDGRWQATARDITQRKHLERELRERTEQLVRTFEAMDEGVYIYDSTGRLAAMNAAARSLAGYDLHPEWEQESVRDRFSRLKVRDVTGRPILPGAWPVQRVLRGDIFTSAAPIEVTIRTSTGRDMIQHITGAPLRDAEAQIVGAVLVWRDVTEQRRLERELAARAHEIESIFETETDAVMLFDTEGRTIRMNAAQRRLLGYEATGQAEYIPSAEERARNFVVCDVRGRPLPKEAWPIYRVLRGESLVGSDAVEMSLRSLDGREIQVSVSGAPIFDQQGRIVGGVTAARDVTEQRRLEQQRMDIFSVVAHDLANPLAAIKMYLQMQQRSIEDGRPSRIPDPELVETIAHSVARMERLVSDMRTVVGLESKALMLDRKPCDLGALCQQEARSLQMTETRALRVILPDEPVIAWADTDRIGQVLTNLLSNADRYSPFERPITLALRLEGDPPGAESAPARQARVLVQDEGPGIPESEQEHIWERFHRVPGTQPRPGTGGSLGLGLYISREIIERHGGAMGVESTPGKGSTFWFTLPLTAPA